MATNFETALNAERKRVVRHFQRFTSEQRADHAASFRLGYRQRAAVGSFFYTHPAVPGVAFDTRKAAASAALTRAQLNDEIAAIDAALRRGREIGNMIVG